MGNYNAVSIAGRNAKSFALSAAANNSGNLTSGNGIYTVWADVDCWIAVADATVGPIPALSTSNGLKIFAGNQIDVAITAGQAIHAIAGGAGTFFYHRVN